MNDITQRKMIQAQLNHVQKMESIGHLAAGIAHEINTPIHFIGSNLQFLQEVFKNLTPLLEEVSTLVHRPPPGTLNSKSLDPLKKRYEESELDYWVTEMPLSIHQSLEGVEQVAKIVKAVKEFSHPPPEEKTWVDLNRAVENTVLVSRNEWKYVAELETDLDPNLPPVACLEDQIKQVLLNLIVNAAHAIEERKDRPAHQKGQITLSTRREGDGVEIRVSDSGQGIPKAIRSKIFDPFFTTKEVGQGTGQGLAITHAIIVNKHGGTITVESEEGRGSTFRIRLPLGMAPKEPADPPPAEVVRPLPLKSETL
ncbi:MAG: ATP-binding protein [Nitrospinaceae bacterium]|nr:ATP-binding protein [Nitrospinaceae bacterium]NIU43944.1 ATP-binding protein [Nitrospinaceae bacterium]NIU96057.1 ATP-binding protein [Nitrospinaceae bacterium]NIW05535.1 ATP-binding protein [Nitrospinaceae bacterium]NIW58704.1 ATP-binding protein [Nitrospinaceae bacterium]